jgi:AraC-like DNA-binding protein/quercetin dioxygenase-like cupin family protein
MTTPSWRAHNRRFAAWVQQLAPIHLTDVQIRVLRLHDVEAKSGGNAGGHVHAWVECSVVQRGAIRYCWNGEERRVAAGGSFVMPAGRRHSWRTASGPALVTGYQLLVTARSGGSRQLDAWWERFLHNGGWHSPPHPLPLAVTAALHDASTTADLGCQLMRTHLLWTFQQRDLGECLSAGGSASTSNDDTMQRVREYVLEHLAEPVRLATLAQRFSLSPRHLNRRFVAEFEKPIHRMVVDERLDRAAHSLRWRDDSAAEIARSVGYGDPGYFGRLFKARFGLSPERWRMAQQSS